MILREKYNIENRGINIALLEPSYFGKLLSKIHIRIDYIPHFSKSQIFLTHRCAYYHDTFFMIKNS